MINPTARRAYQAEGPEPKRKAKSPEPPPPLVAKAWRHPFRATRNAVQNLVTAVPFAYAGPLVIAAIYYMLFELWKPATDAWHTVVSNGDLRHNIRDVGEGLLGGLYAQAILWNHWRKPGLIRRIGMKLRLVGTRERPGRLDRLEIALHVPNLQDDRGLDFGKGTRDSLRHLGAVGRALTAVGVPIACVVRFVVLVLLVLIYAVPGFFIAWLITRQIHTVTDPYVHVSHHATTTWQKIHETVTLNWDKKVMGFAAAYFFGRRPVRPVFDDAQAFFVERRVAAGKPLRWWHPPAFRAHYNDVAGHGLSQTARLEAQGEAARAHAARSTAARWAFLGGGVLTLLAAGGGFYVINYIAR